MLKYLSSHIHVFLAPSTELTFQTSTGQGSREMQMCYTKEFLEFPTDSFIKMGCSAIIVRSQANSLRGDYCKKDY